MSDVTQAVEQAEIADSILSAPIVGSWKDGALAESAAEAPEPVSIEPGGGDLLADLQTDRTDQSERENAREPVQGQEREGRESQNEPNQPQPLTPEQYNEGIKQADALIEGWGLNQGSEKFSAELSQLTGIEYDRCQSFSNSFSRSFVSAREDFLAADGDMDKLRPLSPLEVGDANRAVADFFGIDLQMQPAANPQAVAQIYRLGMCNLFDTMIRSQGVTDVTQLNDKRMAVWFCEALGEALLGTHPPTDERVAVQLVNLMTQRIVNDFIPKARDGSASSARRSGGRRQVPTSRFRTNRDLFDDETEERVKRERIERSDLDFTPKPRRGPSRFQTNTDIFNDETDAIWQREYGRL